MPQIKMQVLPLLLLLSLTSIGLPRFAVADETGNSLADLHYRPGRSVFFGRFDLTPDIFYRTYVPAGDPSSFGTRTHIPLTAALTYGIADSLSLGLSESFLFHSVVHPAGAAITNDDSTAGFSDPTVSLNCRYVGELEGNFFADFFANASPSIGQAETNTFPGGGNNLRGASTYQVGTTAYAVSGEHEGSMSASGTIQTPVDSTGGTLASTSTRNSFLTFAVRGEYRYHFNEKLFADAEGTLNFLHTVEGTFPNSVVARTTITHYPYYLVPRVEIGYLPNPALLFVLGLSYVEYTSSTTVNRLVATTTDTEVKEVILDAGVRFLF